MARDYNLTRRREWSINLYFFLFSPLVCLLLQFQASKRKQKHQQHFLLHSLVSLKQLDKKRRKRRRRQRDVVWLLLAQLVFISTPLDRYLFSLSPFPSFCLFFPFLLSGWNKTPVNTFLVLHACAQLVRSFGSSKYVRMCLYARVWGIISERARSGSGLGLAICRKKCARGEFWPSVSRWKKIECRMQSVPCANGGWR